MNCNIKLMTQQQLLNEIKADIGILKGFQGFVSYEAIANIKGYPFFLVAYSSENKEAPEVTGILQFHTVAYDTNLDIEYILIALVEVKKTFQSKMVGLELAKYFNELFENQLIVCEMLLPFRENSFKKVADRVLSRNKVYTNFGDIFENYRHYTKLFKNNLFHVNHDRR